MGIVERVRPVAHQHRLDLARRPVRAACRRNEILGMDDAVVDRLDQALVHGTLRLADVDEQRHVPLGGAGLDHRLQLAVGGGRDVDDLDAGHPGEGVEEVLLVQRAGRAAPARHHEPAAGALWPPPYPTRRRASESSAAAAPAPRSFAGKLRRSMCRAAPSTCLTSRSIDISSLPVVGSARPVPHRGSRNTVVLFDQWVNTRQGLSRQRAGRTRASQAECVAPVSGVRPGKGFGQKLTHWTKN